MALAGNRISCRCGASFTFSQLQRNNFRKKEINNFTLTPSQPSELFQNLMLALRTNPSPVKDSAELQLDSWKISTPVN